MSKLGIILLLFCSSARAIDFFETPINWDDQKQEAPKKIVEKEEPKDSFDWKNYLDPKNNPKEFFKEGDYVPPRPFMELATNPNDENIRNWFKYIEKKNELSERLNLRIKEYLARNTTLPEPSRQSLSKSAQELPVSEPDSSDYRFRFYFDSHCPHCKRMFGTMRELQSEGYYVEVVQVDNDRKHLNEYPFPVRPATKEELKAHNISSVPFVLVADLKAKVLLPPIRGYQSIQNVKAFLANAKSARNQMTGGKHGQNN